MSLIVFPPEFGALYKNSLGDAPSFYCFTIQARMRLKEKNQKDVDFDLCSSSTFSCSLKLGPNYLEWCHNFLVPRPKVLDLVLVVDFSNCP